MSTTLEARGLKRAIYVKPRVQQFNARQHGDLAGTLRTMDRNTSVRPVADIDELQLSDDGRTIRDGFSFTFAAFNQAAQILAPGLSKLLPDLSGTVALPDEREQLVDAMQAIHLWNALVDLRFPLFQRHRAIRNDDARTIEGFVGFKHQYLENLALYQEASETLANYQPDVSMYAGLLVGRRFSVWFRSNQPMFSKSVDDKQWPFYHGYYFTNGEATGTSVRGTQAIFTPKGVALGPYRGFGRRVTHTGKDFVQRLGQMLAEVCQHEIPVEALESGAAEMIDRPLGFNCDSNKESRKERSKKLIHSLSLLGVTKNLAGEIVQKGLTEGRNHGLNLPPVQRISHLYATRTLLDLFVPLLWVARKVDLARREKLEQAAYEMLTGRVLL